MNRLISPVAFALGLLGYVGSSVAGGEPFTGNWTIDLRTPAERQRSAECGSAEFVLTQAGDAIIGTHSMAVVGCGRLNEGGPVRGVAVGKTAVQLPLRVTDPEEVRKVSVLMTNGLRPNSTSSGPGRCAKATRSLP